MGPRSPRAMRAALFALLVLSIVPAAAQPAGPDPAPPRPITLPFAATGLRVTLPADWDGAAAADESALPAYALYTFEGGAAGGALLRVERVVGLSPLERERWRTGAVRYGYHGTRPVGAIGVPVEGLGLEVAGPGRGGAVAFVQRGGTYWALHVSAPAAAWETHRADLLAVLAGVQLP